VATYLPTVNLAPLFNFVQFTTGGGASALQTALNAMSGVTNVQCFADAQTSGNALVVHNETTVFSVPPNNYVGFNQGQWTQYPAAKLAGGANSTFTAYP
jgi:hypothetical protein